MAGRWGSGIYAHVPAVSTEHCTTIPVQSNVRADADELNCNGAACTKRKVDVPGLLQDSAGKFRVLRDSDAGPTQRATLLQLHLLTRGCAYEKKRELCFFAFATGRRVHAARNGGGQGSEARPD